MKDKLLSPAFFQRNNVLQIARELVGMVLITSFRGKTTAGLIAETEAYEGVVDKASHAYGGRLTPRNEVMYAEGGTTYVYICYGMHHLFNIVTARKNIPHAVLIRALEPLDGIETMMKRRRFTSPGYSLTRGPGSLSVAMGINRSHSGMMLNTGAIQIADRGLPKSTLQIIATKRIGVESAGAAAHYPYRFIIRNSLWVSGSKKNNSEISA